VIAATIVCVDSAISIRVTSDPQDWPFGELAGPVVLAEQCGEAVAAVDLESGAVVSDPQRSSSSVLTVLQLHRLEARLIGALVGG
jgi:hypothetical protein